MDEKIKLEELKTYLWGAATLLRGQIDASGYKEYIFPLLFFKRISDVYDEEYAANLALAKGDAAFADSQDYLIRIPKGAHWRDVRSVSEDIGARLVEAFNRIESENPPKLIDERPIGGLAGIFGDKSIWTNKQKMPDSIIASLINHFNGETLSLARCPADEMGTGYEYLIGQFANDAGHTAQEFYTNRTVVTLMARILEPKPGESIYDPTCGSGGMLIKSLEYVRETSGDAYRSVKVFGQEVNHITSAIARMNLYLHGVTEFAVIKDDTLANPRFVRNGGIETFDVVLANPPYSIKNWNRGAFEHDLWKRNFLGTPPQGRADYAFIQHILASMDRENGRCAILLPHGVLNRTAEKEMREALVKLDWLDCVIGIGKNLFFNSPMEACVMIANRNKPAARRGKVMFLNAKHYVERKGGESYLTDEQIDLLAKTYHRNENVEGLAYVATNEEIGDKQYSLSVNRYVRRADDAEDFDFPAAGCSWKAASEEMNAALATFAERV